MPNPVSPCLRTFGKRAFWVILPAPFLAPILAHFRTKDAGGTSGTPPGRPLWHVNCVRDPHGKPLFGVPMFWPPLGFPECDRVTPNEDRHRLGPLRRVISGRIRPPGLPHGPPCLRTFRPGSPCLRFFVKRHVFPKTRITCTLFALTLPAHF